MRRFASPANSSQSIPEKLRICVAAQEQGNGTRRAASPANSSQSILEKLRICVAAQEQGNGTRRAASPANSSQSILEMLRICFAPQEQGIAAAKKRGVRFGRSQAAVPDNFGEIVTKWENGQIKFDDVIQECNMSHATFYRRLREYRMGRET